MIIGYKIIILILMLWLHIVDDYYLQGILAKMKQRAWWDENAPKKLYRHDYKVALAEHAFSWTSAIMLPVIIVYLFRLLDVNFVCIIICFGFNVFLHALVDNEKANKRTINLLTDQTVHIIQIVITWFECFFMFAR